MNKKRLVAALASVAVVATLFAGCTAKKEEGTNTPTKTESKSTVKLGMATDQGGLGDKSFNDSAYAGLQKIEKEYGIKPTVLQSKQQENYEPNLKNLSKEHDLTFAIGFMMKDALTKVAKENPDKKFAIIDSSVELDNVKSISFKEEEGSFLMGVIAGKTTKSNKVGFIGGVDMPLIQKFEAGFIAGVKAVNPDAAKGLLDRTTVKYVGNFNDSAKGYEVAKSLYNDGCDVVYHAAGAAGLGLFKAAQEMKKQAIGVDQDQAVTASQYKDVIISSMIKRVDTATYLASKEIIDGNFRGGTKNSMVLGLKEDGVGIADTTKDHVSQDIIDLANKYKQDIIDGKITVPATLDELKK